MTQRANPLWATLAKRAEQKATDALTALVAEKRKRAGLAQRERQIADMRADYTGRLLAAESRAHLIGDSVVYRRFLAQIATLQRTLEAAIAEADAAVRSAQDRYDRADEERIRMKFLADREADRVARAQKAREQRDLDAIGIAQFVKRRRDG